MKFSKMTDNVDLGLGVNSILYRFNFYYQYLITLKTQNK